MGSMALDLAWAAAGRFDFYYYESVLKPWDIAARVIAEEAGLVTDLIPAEEDLPGALLVAPAVIHPGFRGPPPPDGGAGILTETKISATAGARGPRTFPLLYPLSYGGRWLNHAVSAAG